MRTLTAFLCLTFAVLLFSAGEGFALPTCPAIHADGRVRFVPDESWDNCFGIYTFGPSSPWAGDKYVGEWRDRTPNGKGTYTSANGDRYVGEIKGWERHGHGTVTFASGGKYVGEFRGGKFNGQGTFTHADGGKYVGEYRDDKKHGQGTYTFADGRVKEGIWKDNEFQYARKDPKVEERRKAEREAEKREAKKNEVISAASGSGFAVSSNGHVITNNHVIDGCQRVQIHHKGKSLPATIITFDPSNDLALLQGDFRPSTVFALSKEKPELLQDIYVAGYPFGQKISTSVKVTKGIISSLTGIGNNFSNIQIDAALQPGNSGGPISPHHLGTRMRSQPETSLRG